MQKIRVVFNVFDVRVYTHRETNLKVRQALVETAEMNDDVEQLSAFDGRLYVTVTYLLHTRMDVHILSSHLISSDIISSGLSAP